jgi:thioredoxin 1
VATIELTQNSFEKTVTDNDIVIIDFWAPWCAPCKNFGPIYESTSEKYSDIIFAKVNTEEEQGLAANFQIRSIPTLMIFREQIVIFSQPGSLPAEALEDIIKKVKDLDMDMVRQEVAKQAAEQAKAAPASA